MKSPINTRVSVLALAVACASGSVFAAEPAASVEDAIMGGSAKLDLRYRFEYVDMDGPTKEATASTLKTRLSFKTLDYQGLSAVLEFDANSEVIEDNYNSTQNGQTRYAVVADPTYTEINQAYLDYKAPADTLIRYGRQRINLDNQRFVGGAAWRQNEQTFDAITVVNQSLPDTAITLSYITNVNDIFGKNVNGEDHQIIHLNNKSLSFGAISAYAYLLDKISDTYGARFAGSAPASDDLKINYAAEYALQKADNAASNEADYYLLEGGVTAAGVTATLGYEVLTSDNKLYSFQTPLATKHKFNGWADAFLATPGDGLEDVYVSLASKALGPALTLAYHEFQANEGSNDYGNEVDFAVGQDFAKHYNALVKFAHYDAKDAKKDTDKIWLQLSAKF
ncbi:MAG: alginate export family protein [Hahellaceae bacterium]|nr:alginate export family protein [Hahellaceae bacterium]MCP5170540.1 alginate export family protein [Hahellaceae bacterium]